jgi:serine phosphatase RsbU (regulator of sigma subunit)
MSLSERAASIAQIALFASLPASELEGLAELPPALSRLPAAEICASIWSLVGGFAGDAPQSDDFTVVVMKREA